MVFAKKAMGLFLYGSCPYLHYRFGDGGQAGSQQIQTCWKILELEGSRIGRFQMYLEGLSGHLKEFEF